MASLEAFARGGYRDVKAEWYMPFWVGSLISTWMEVTKPLQDILELRCFGRRASTGQCIGAGGAIFVGMTAIGVGIVWFVFFVHYLLTRADAQQSGGAQREKAD